MKCLEIKELTASACPINKGNGCLSCSYFCGVVGNKIECSALSISEQEELMKDKLNRFIDELKNTDHSVAPIYVISKLNSVLG